MVAGRTHCLENVSESARVGHWMEHSCLGEPACFAHTGNLSLRSTSPFRCLRPPTTPSLRRSWQASSGKLADGHLFTRNGDQPHDAGGSL